MSPHVGLCRGLLVGMANVVGLGGKAHDRANVGLTWGWKTRHPIKVPHGAER